jgi:hypothetical protein
MHASVRLVSGSTTVTRGIAGGISFASAAAEAETASATRRRGRDDVDDRGRGITPEGDERRGTRGRTRGALANERAAGARADVIADGEAFARARGVSAGGAGGIRAWMRD